jgi:hypothetical protein
MTSVSAAPVVFISHAQADAALAREVAECLSREGFRPWLAEDQVTIGENWAQRVGDALATSEAMVALVAPGTGPGSGSNVALEIGYALGERRYARRVIPVLVHGAAESELPWILKQFHFVRASEEWSGTCAEIVRVLREATRTTG